MPSNPKILGLLEERDGHRAAFVWVCCMAYSGEHETDGFIPRSAAPFVHGRAQDFARLVAVEALKEVAGGWEIPSWDEFQLSTDDAKRRRERAQKAAAVRWSKAEAKKQTPKRRGIEAV